MKIENIAALDFAAYSTRPAADVVSIDRARENQTVVESRPEQKSRPDPLQIQETEEAKVTPSEILERIREISRDGYYSVRFEKNAEFEEIVVKVVDRFTDEVIRELPPEAVLRMKAKLTDYSGNIFKGVS